MIVVDTSIIAYLHIPGAFTALAERLLAKDPQWAAPMLWRSEFCNALALYLRKGLLSIDETLDFMAEAEATIGDNEYQVDPADVLRLAVTSGQTAYDCEFIALAQQLRVPLVTTDRKLLRAFPSVAISLAIATA